MIFSGADAVVMLEACKAVKDDDGDKVMIRHIPQAVEWIRHAGDDIRAGSTIRQGGAAHARTRTWIGRFGQNREPSCGAPTALSSLFYRR